MSSTAQPVVQAKAPAIIRVLEKFDCVIFECDGKESECSIKTAIFELQRTKRTLADVQLIDFDQAYRSEHPRSRQCQQVFDALLSAGLPDPVFARVSQ